MNLQVSYGAGEDVQCAVFVMYLDKDNRTLGISKNRILDQRILKYQPNFKSPMAR